MRIFTGLALPLVLQRDAESILAELCPHADLRWSPPQNLHITTAFIGSWLPEDLPRLQTALAGVRSAPVRITVTGFGWFPNPHRPHSLFLAVQREPALEELVAGIVTALRSVGWQPEDRPYTPHITLARIARENITQLRFQTATMNSLFPLETVEVSEFHLYESRPTATGSEYTTLSTFAFREARR